SIIIVIFFFQAEDGIRDFHVTGVQTCALPILIIFLFISFVIANVFLAYLIGGDKLISYITDNPLNHISNLISLLIFTAVFYFVRSEERRVGKACSYLLFSDDLIQNYRWSNFIK